MSCDHAIPLDVREQAARHAEAAEELDAHAGDEQVLDADRVCRQARSTAARALGDI